MPAVSDREGVILEHNTRPFADVAKGYTRFRDGDVIFAKITPCMENGKIAIAEGLRNGFACGSTEFHVLRSNGNILPQYLWRFLRHKSFRVDAERHMTGAVGQRRVPAQYIKDAAIPLPPVSEQRRIVAKIDNLLARSKNAREELARVPRLVQRNRQAVLATAFRGDLPRVPLSDVMVSTFYGPRISSDAYVEDGIPTLRTTDIGDWGRLILQRPPNVRVTTQEFERWGFRDQDLMVTRTGATIGKCALYLGSLGPAIPSAYLIRLRLRLDIIDARYALLFLLSPDGQEQLLAGRTATAQPNVNSKAISDIQIPVPDLTLQRRIVHSIDNDFLWIDRVEGEASRALSLIERLDQATLTKAFRGELVPQEGVEQEHREEVAAE
jgi:type I restriction enzyme S subunit